ncbi:gustatory receptor for bitter taste 66a [Musca vetustissima]|uniref:gustatory receptor for bitter taste 66a n=1 Tax=Musca vetustissima TaxID=27455 RepID=UPI002AB6C1AB|nr:gustatory receptor for bitter taste 66a [Musca vetustissima]
MSQQQTVQTILLQFSELFLLCKILGIYPQNWKLFQRHHELKKSNSGALFVVFVMLVIIVLYNLLIFSFSEEDSTLKASQSTLTFVIGIFLTYIGLVMMVTDQLSAIRNQKHLGEIYDRIRKVDERLFRVGCVVNNSVLEIRIRIMIVLTFVCEITIMIAAYVVLLDHSKLSSLLWIFSCLPTLYNSLDKIWFATTLYALQQRFAVINRALEDMVEDHERYKAMMAHRSRSGSSNMEKNKNIINDLLFDIAQEDILKLNYLRNELSGSGLANKFGKNRIKPVITVANSMNNFNQFQSVKKQPNKSAINIHYESELCNVSRVEEKLNDFCQLHDEICEIGKKLNELWSYSILVLMAYGFLIFTAQLYFLYCATQDQPIPSLFLSAKNALITATFLLYTAGKCVYIIYLSWRTSLESKHTGICLHKCGVVADDNNLYEIINHLSLKLLNHSVDFTACGFFSLDMETLYGVAGGITSYLIILIQFNLAAQQAKDAAGSHNTNDPSQLSDGTENSSETGNDYSTSLTTLLTPTSTAIFTSSSPIPN